MQRLALVALLLASCAHTPAVAPQPSAPQLSEQNPSPMVDNTRAHERVAKRPLAGRTLTIADVLAKPVEVLVTPAAQAATEADLVIHFHGASYIAMQAAEDMHAPIVVAVVNLGAGGSLYGAAFREAGTFTNLTAAIERATNVRVAHRYLVGFSAGYGAIRSILRNHYDEIDGVLLLDGLHTSYIPERTPLASGGTLDESGLDVFRRYAADAVAEKKRFLITHSEIFPGTFASTTETTDYLIQSLGLKRTPVVEWGPLGMQQLSETKSGLFSVLGFAGNTAPDHIDHLHALGRFLPMMMNAPYARRADGRGARDSVLGAQCSVLSAQ